MEFLVPKFIEKEPKVLGALTFKQALYVGFGAVICFLLYFSWGKNHHLPFFALASLIMALALSLAFLKIEGFSLPAVIVNFLKHHFAPRTYLWQKRPTKTGFYQLRKERKKEKAREEISLKIEENSMVQAKKRDIEIGLR